jgi:hypothetical protein
MDDDKIDISDEVDALSEEKFEIAVQRACHRYGIDFDDIAEYADNDDFQQIVIDEVKYMVVKDIIGKLHAEGLIEPSEITEEGEIKYGITEAGKEAFDAYKQADSDN